LSGKRLNPLGIDANIFASLAYDSTQRWAAAFMEHPDAPNGIRYPSSKKRALTQFALFSSPAVMTTVTISHGHPLLNHPNLFRLLQSYKVALI
jgi:RES domain